MVHQLSRWFQSPSRRGATCGLRVPRPRLELLEDRLAPAIFNVNSLADILNPPAGVVTLRSAIQGANATPGGNSINLTIPGNYKITLRGTAGESDNAAGEFAILPAGGNLTITNTSGAAVSVDGNYLNRVFDINPGNTDNPATKILVSFQGFTIQNGIATDAANADGPNASGGGIRDQGNANLTLTNMVVTNNAATADGGGLVMEDAPASAFFTLTINASTISNNHAGDAGGGVDADGKGTVLINAGTVISGNTDLNQGAGVYLDAIGDGVASVIITNPGAGYVTAPTVTFSAPQNAGGTTATGTASITAGTVTSVTITNPGAGYTAAPTVTFSPPPVGTTATGTANLGFNNTANLTMTGTIVSGNTSTGTANGLGGGISNAGNGAVTITASTIENNFAATTGGGFSDENNGLGTLTILSSIFLNNSAVGNGGGIFMSDPTASITGSVIEGNTTNANGGGLFDGGTRVFAQSSTFAGNTASGNGGGIEIQTTGTGGNGSTLTNCTLTGNSALNNAGGNNGGGIDAPTAFTGALTLLNDTINGNFASNGGGIFWAGATGSAFMIENTIIAGNRANTGPDANNPAATFSDSGGNAVGVSGAGSGNTGFSNVTTQTGTTANPLDLRLGALQNNNGPLAGAPTSQQVVPTEALLPGSPAIGKGVANGAPSADQRGFVRPGGGNAQLSVGAFEPESPAGASANQVYVENVYEFLLGRAADAGASGWVQFLNMGGSAVSVVAGIESSTEYRTDVVQGLYQHYLHRAADANGLTAFVNALGSGATVEQMAAVIAGSDEYFALHGGTVIGFLAGLYQEALNRMADPAGLAFFNQALAGGLSRTQAAAMFFSSTEYRGDLVQSDYRLALERPADVGGLVIFVTDLQAGASDQAVLAGILGSLEAFALRS